jgi:hypothetical protein
MEINIMAIQRINTGSSRAMIRELWIGDSIEELNAKMNETLSRYHPAGYGTHFSEVKPCDDVPGVRNYKGKFFTNLSRGTSCD